MEVKKYRNAIIIFTGFDLKKYVSDQYNWFGPNSKFEPNPGSASYPKLGG